MGRVTVADKRPHTAWSSILSHSRSEMQIERLLTMANDIANFFASEPDEAAAAAGTASHLRRFWDPRMRREIVAHHQTGGEGLGEIARAAVALLAQESAVEPR